MHLGITYQQLKDNHLHTSPVNEHIYFLEKTLDNINIKVFRLTNIVVKKIIVSACANFKVLLTCDRPVKYDSTDSTKLVKNRQANLVLS
ncbi:18834_t:CDS:2 [Racocetra fulgida]|uniref:18834_t:CDS:1 n=1 Tax=Racocetra fulgida TaxID=60492 RepID=A0A9N8VMK6_9GLOM|nr:18834_t:CDS:2 [Racocetra fulgida]